MTKRRERSDSPHVLAAIAQAATKTILPPAPMVLTERLKPFWDRIIAARFEWTDVDLINAHNLATLMAEVHEMNENWNYTEMKDIEVMVKVRDKMLGRITSLSVKLQIHAIATVGDVEDTRKKNAAKGKAVRALATINEEDDLIARPLN